MASPLESAWKYLITNYSDFQLACIGSFILHESVFFLSGLPFIFLERRGYLTKYKIQAKSNTPTSQEKCIMHLLLYHFCVNLPVMLLSYPVFRAMGMRSTLPLPSWYSQVLYVLCLVLFSLLWSQTLSLIAIVPSSFLCFHTFLYLVRDVLKDPFKSDFLFLFCRKEVVPQIIFYFILEDFVFYWGHRILHTKWLYQHIHSVHHEYATPFGLTSEYAHPAEILFLGFATILGPAITGPHLFTLWLWMVLRVLETVEAHCGYHFPWSPSNFIPLYGGSDFHDYHHRLLYTKSGNYSSTFVYMDRIFGTDVGYRKLKALKTAEAEAEADGKKM